ncbi:unnamed protein product [Toxocara canis]|nr:unnamed protein product [Toxocara canis]
MSGYWMDDGTNSANSWYGQQGASQQQSWAQFDYSQPQPSYYSQHAMPQASNYYNGNMFIPSQNNAPVAGDDFENEPPLLEELGIDFSHIKEKTVAVLNPFGSVAADVIADQDLAGPLVFCLLFGGALLLHGKVHFGYIYGIGGVGCMGMYMLMNLMSAEKSISFTCTVSILGYCLLPMALLSLLAAFLSFQAMIGYVVSGAAVLWCSVASSKLFVITLAMDSQRLLVAYPCTLLYCVFALLAIF